MTSPAGLRHGWFGPRLLVRLRHLYESDTREGVRFRYGLLTFDFATVTFIIVSSFLPRSFAMEVLDVLIGIPVAADFIVRILISRERLRGFSHPYTWADLVAVLSFLSPIVGEGAAFLRVLRILRLLKTYELLVRLRADFPFFRKNEEVILAAANLVVFLFVMTGIVYETQHWTNAKIQNYVDALYFTVTSLTTTGFGDITLEGTSGRLISVAIMIVGVTLFLRLAQVIVRPHKVRFPCPTCGLQRHEPDAVHCKACGTLLNIPDEGD